MKKRNMKKNRNKIFVQLASYRDPELLPTIKDILDKAKKPENLTFGICWQHSEEDEWDDLTEYVNDKRFRIIDVPWNESKGLCWARSEIQKLWDGEEYTLQLDSHHRMLENWDEELINMLHATGSEKPIITSYAGMYDPVENKKLNVEPYKMVASNFTNQGTILFRPHSIPNWEQLTKPIPARFVSGHFFFTIGKHCEEYKYDPNIYFAGDEISLSIRSFTLGYDLYHPHKTVVWHEYTREGRTKHWTDFDKNNLDTGKVKETWSEMDDKSKRRLRHMLQEEDNNIDLGEYGLGDVRTHHDYELYAGINFKHKALHPKTLEGETPPVLDNSEWYMIPEQKYKISLNVPSINEQFKFIYIGIEDAMGKVLHRKDLTTYVPKLELEFSSFTNPEKCVYWVYSVDNKWTTRIDIPI